MLHSPSVSETSAAQGVPTPEPRGDSSGSMQDRAEGADAQLNLLKAEAIALRESGDKIGALAKVRQIRALKAQQQADERQMALELAHMTGLVWARGLLANPEERRKVSDTEFRRQDVDNNGVLDKSEALTVVERMCTKFGLTLPKKEKISELFSLCDKNGDGVIQIAEFRNYFRIVLESCVGKAESEPGYATSSDSLPPPDSDVMATQIRLPPPESDLRGAGGDKVPPLPPPMATPPSSKVGAVPLSSSSSTSSTFYGSLLSKKPVQMALGFPRQTHDPQKREFLVNRKLMAGFNTWRTAVATFLEIIQLTVGHWRGQEMMRGWNRWQIRRDDTFRLRAWLEQALRMALAVAAARGWRGWLAMLEIQQEYQCLMRYSLARFMDARAPCALASWKHALQVEANQRRLANAMATALKHMLQRRHSLGLNTWIMNVERRTQYKAALHRGIFHLKKRCESRGWNGWVEATEGRRMWATRLRSVLRTFSLSKTWRCWNRWKVATALRVKKARTDVRARHVQRRIFERRILLAWNMWAELHEERLKTSEVLERGLNFLLKWKLPSRCLNTWADASRVQMHTTMLFTRGMSWIRNTSGSRAFAAWKFAVHLASAKARAGAKQSRAIKRLSSIHVARGFGAWWEMVEIAAAMTLASRRVLSLWAQRHSGRAWGAWLEMLELRVAFEKQLGVASRVLLRRKLSIRLGLWKVHRWARRVVLRGVRHLASRQKRRSMNVWRAICHGQIGHKTALLRAEEYGLRTFMTNGSFGTTGSTRLRHWRNQGLSRGWITWMVLRAKMTSAQEQASRSLAHRRRSALAFGWTTWAAASADGYARRMTETKANCVRMLHVLRVGRAFGEWELNFISNRILLDNVAQSMSRLRFNELSRAWRMLAGEVAERGGRHEAMIERSVAFLKKNDTARAWSLWHAVWRELAAQSEAMRRGAGHFIHGNRALCWNAWIDFGAARGRNTRLLLRGVFFSMKSLQAFGFCCWRDFVALEQGRRTKTRRMTHAIRNINTRRRYGIAWTCWVTRCEKRFSDRRRIRQAVGHFASRRLSRAWVTWVPQSEERKRHILHLRNALRFMVRNYKSQALKGWRATHAFLNATREKNEDIVRSIVRMIKRGSLHRGWCTWHAIWKERECMRLGAKLSLGHARYRLLSKVYVAWRMHAAEMQAAIDFAAMQFSHVVVVRPQLASSPGAALAQNGAKRQPGTPTPAVQRLWKCSETAQHDYALLHAAQEGHLATVRVLTNRGARVCVRDGKDQRNALHIACFEGFLDIVRVLLEVGDVDDFLEARDLGGNTAYMLACMRGYLTIMRVLKEAGADERAEEHDGTRANRSYPRPSSRVQ